MTRLIVMIALSCAIGMGQSLDNGHTLDAPFQIRYASNLNVGDSLINITNTGANGNNLFGPGFGHPIGNICVNVYAYSTDEQLISCCSCLVTPNGLVHITANNDLVSNTLTGIRPNSIVIKLVASATGYEKRHHLDGGDTNEPSYSGSSCTNSAALVGNTFPVAEAGMLAWGTTLHSATTPSGGGPAAASPDTVNAPGASWFPNGGPTATNTPPHSGIGFWDSPSFDGDKCGVGYFLNGTNNPACLGGSSAIASPPGNLAYLAAISSNGGTSAPSLTFTPGGTETGTFLAYFTAFSNGANSDVFGWTTDNGVTLHPLFTAGVTPVGTSVPFTPGGVFQYYLKNGAGRVFLSGANGKQFVLFSQTPPSPTGPPTALNNYWVGVEDLDGPKIFPGPGFGSDYDYNDLIVQIIAPESGSGLSETPFLPATLNHEELLSITGRCANIIGNGSTFGQCNSCRLGGLGGSKL